VSGYEFKDGDGKKTYVDFKWDDDDFVIDVTNIQVQRIEGSSDAEYYPNSYVNKEFALEMGWFVEKSEDTYGLGPNLVMETLDDKMPRPSDIDPLDPEYKFIRLTLTCNWKFINLNVPFIYSDVGGSGVVGNQVMDLLHEVNYNREGKGSQYF